MAMKTFDTVVTVPEDRTVTLQLPAEVGTGRHRIVVVIEDEETNPESEQKPKEFVFPVMPEAQWPDDMPLRREDLYGDDGR